MQVYYAIEQNIGMSITRDKIVLHKEKIICIDIANILCFIMQQN